MLSHIFTENGLMTPETYCMLGEGEWKTKLLVWGYTLDPDELVGRVKLPYRLKRLNLIESVKNWCRVNGKKCSLRHCASLQSRQLGARAAPRSSGSVLQGHPCCHGIERPLGFRPRASQRPGSCLLFLLGGLHIVEMKTNLLRHVNYDILLSKICSLLNSNLYDIQFFSYVFFRKN